MILKRCGKDQGEREDRKWLQAAFKISIGGMALSIIGMAFAAAGLLAGRGGDRSCVDPERAPGCPAERGAA